MRGCLILFFILHSFSLHAGSKGIERVNFFPDSDAWLSAGYSYSRLEIETPQETIQAKEVRNYYNLFQLTYAHRFGRKYFGGVRLGIEEASENAALYGVPLRRRFTSSGLVDPEIFTNYRLRFQKEDKGNIDFHFSLSPSPGTRKISRATTNRFSGRNTLRGQLNFGFHEEKWEFLNAFGVTYHFPGREENEFLGGVRFRPEVSYNVDFAFTSQYALRDSLFLAGTIGIIYRSTEVVRQMDGEKRELRSGTGSLFRIALKKTFSEWTMIEAGYALRRSEYFVKAETFNLDGDLKSHQLFFNYVVLF